MDTIKETFDERLLRARQFADVAHGGQRYGEHQYNYHLEKVYRTLLRFKVGSDELLIAAFLHDVLEDTPTNFSDVFRAFGPEVAELVYAVTDELGRNRGERHAKTYPKIRELPQAVTLKLADRIANVEHSIYTMDVGKLSMYRREHQEFHEALGAHGPARMWEELEILFDVKTKS
jgi:(p)ppGpp synthase/HD superfamily hydrolase